MFEFILMAFFGLLFIFLGRGIWKKEQITLIHSYHYKKVAEENKKDYTEEIGKSIIFIGIGMLLTGIIDFITKTAYGWLFFTIFFILGFIKIFKAQKKYNDGIFWIFISISHIIYIRLVTLVLNGKTNKKDGSI